MSQKFELSAQISSEMLITMSGSLSLSTVSNSAANPGLSLQEVDLTGDREFLTKETAERALAPLFAEGSAVKRVGLYSCRNAGLLGLQIPASCHGEHLEHVGRKAVQDP